MKPPRICSMPMLGKSMQQLERTVWQCFHLASYTELLGQHAGHCIIMLTGYQGFKDCAGLYSLVRKLFQQSHKKPTASSNVVDGERFCVYAVILLLSLD